MLKSFTRNYEDNSTEAGYQFTFYCDNCHDGYRSSFIESETYNKGKSLRGLATGAGILGSLLEGDCPVWATAQKGRAAFSQSVSKIGVPNGRKNMRMLLNGLKTKRGSTFIAVIPAISTHVTLVSTKMKGCAWTVHRGRKCM